MTKLSTHGVPGADRSARWSEIISQAYFPLELEFKDPAHFQGRLNHRAFGQVALSRLTSDPVSYTRRGRHIREGLAEDYLITIPRSAPVEFRQLGRDVRCDPGGFIIERGSRTLTDCARRCLMQREVLLSCLPQWLILHRPATARLMWPRRMHLGGSCWSFWRWRWALVQRTRQMSQVRCERRIWPASTYSYEITSKRQTYHRSGSRHLAVFRNGTCMTFSALPIRRSRSRCANTVLLQRKEIFLP